MDYRDHVKLLANRMAGDGKGALYLSDDSLFWMSLDYGDSWHFHRLSPLPGQDIVQDTLPAPFFADPQGAVQWGVSWYSWDQGRNWGYRSGVPLKEASAVVQVKPATYLASFQGFDDRIRNTNDSGLTWKESHALGYYFPVLQFEAPDSQWVFGSGARLLISRTGGATWTQSGATSDGLFPFKISLQRTDSGWTLWAIYDSASFQEGGTVHVPELLRYRSAGAPDSRPFALPDSALTAFRVQDDGTLWLGTWGKGIFSSTDLGTTWIARNQGLGDLRIETLYRSPEGTLFAITPEGVYRRGDPPLALSASPKGRGRHAPPADNPRFFRLSGGPFDYLPDGRRLPSH
ncbi:MAG: hypothetical protein JF616_12060 [Fibrobacteres bacterium]|nr:hypothetical protein [Fibrobacterota bacterium]